MLNSPPPVPTTPDMTTPTTTPPVPTYRDLLAVADADAARTRPGVAHLRTLVPAVPAEDLVDEADA